MFQTKVVEKIETHITFSKFSPKIYDICGKIRQRPQTTIRRMPFACRITRATDTHSYFILTPFHSNYGYANAPPCYVTPTPPTVLSSLKGPKWLWGLHSSLPGALPLAVNRLGRHKSNNLPPPSAKVTNAWSYTSPPHIPSQQGQFYFVTGRIQGLSWLLCRRDKSLQETLYLHSIAAAEDTVLGTYAAQYLRLKTPESRKLLPGNRPPVPEAWYNSFTQLLFC
jgi:hypothetical protein